MIPTFDIRPCTSSHLPDILALQEEAFSVMKDTTMLRRNSPEMLAACLQVPHLTLGAFLYDNLAAISILYVPTTSEEELSPYLKHFNPEGYRCANYKLCIVRPTFRGRQLQYLLGRQLIQEARHRGYNLLCATASPENTHSHNNILRLGFQLDSQSQHYGFLRNLYRLAL